MTPTCKLRFVEREIGYSKTGNITDFKTVRILQQWWEDTDMILAVYRTDKEGNALPPLFNGEWRDVPLEEEQA